MEEIPSEVGKKIEAASGVELNRMVAERIMGWTELREFEQSGVLFGLHPKWGECRMQVPGYATVAVAAAHVSEEMVNRGFEFTLTRTQQPPAAGSKFWHEATFTLWVEGNTIATEASSTCCHVKEAVAVCRAALLVLEKTQA